jgi:hypothetical protein
MTSLTLRAASVALLLIGAHGCGPRVTHEEKVELLRSHYTASLESLTVKQEPMVAGAAEGGGGGAAEPAAPVVRTDAILDIVVSTDAEEQLPGLTLDIEHLDADRRSKDRCTFWVETAALARGQSAQVSHVLENVAWKTGDAYSVEVRQRIPLAERSGYREFEREVR